MSTYVMIHLRREVARNDLCKLTNWNWRISSPRVQILSPFNNRPLHFNCFLCMLNIWPSARPRLVVICVLGTTSVVSTDAKVDRCHMVPHFVFQVPTVWLKVFICFRGTVYKFFCIGYAPYVTPQLIVSFRLSSSGSWVTVSCMTVLRQLIMFSMIR